MNKKLGILLAALGLLVILAGAVGYMKPNVDEISRMKAKAMVSEIISETIKNQFYNNENAEDLFIIHQNKNGIIETVQANTVLMNQKLSELSVTLQEQYEHLQPKEMEIPVGAALGSTLLSQAKGSVPIRVLPLTVSHCSYETSFESQGINQTKYKIHVTIETDVRVLQPFSQETFTVKTNMLFSELIIVGDVPENYVYVPEEDILDVT